MTLRMKAITKKLTVLLLLACILFSFCACGLPNRKDAPVRIKALIVPKFEIDGMTGDFPGEAQLFYEKYCPGLDPVPLPNLPENALFFLNGETGAALLVTGSGKTAAALSMCAVLGNPGLDLSEARIISVGCAGGSYENTTLGDVVLVTAACDNELGHTADIREFENPDADVTWFYDSSYDSTAFKRWNEAFCDQAYTMTKDLILHTTPSSQNVLMANFPSEEWRLREPAVIKGAALSGDSYWKGLYGHKNALAVMDAFGCPDAYAVTEMEELTMANTAACFGMLDRLISFRVVVDLDIFLHGDSPESLWLGADGYNESVDEQSSEAIDIFEIGMKNLFDAAEVVIDAALHNEL